MKTLGLAINFLLVVALFLHGTLTKEYTQMGVALVLLDTMLIKDKLGV